MGSTKNAKKEKREKNKKAAKRIQEVIKQKQIKSKKQEREEFIGAFNKKVDCYWQRVENQMAEEARKLKYVKKIDALLQEDYIDR